jgi:hypothetical protein
VREMGLVRDTPSRALGDALEATSASLRAFYL